MDENPTIPDPNKTRPDLEAHLKLLNLSFMQGHFEPLADQAAQRGWSHVDYLSALADGEAALRHDRAIERRIRLARFPVLKTFEQFRWSWPTAINRASVQNLFRLKFIEEKANVILPQAESD